MDNVIYVDFKSRATLVLPPVLDVPIVGPVLSRINGVLHFTATMTIPEILELAELKYHQPQLENHLC